MSQENVELIERAIEVFNEDPASDAALYLLDPEVAWEENNPFYPGLERVYRGRDGYLRWLQQAVTEPFQEFEIIIDKLEDLGDQVLACIRLRGTGRGSGVDAEMLIFQLVVIRDGKLARRRIYHTRNEALEAAGLSEQAMSQEKVEVVRRMYEEGRVLRARLRTGRWLRRHSPSLLGSAIQPNFTWTSGLFE